MFTINFIKLKCEEKKTTIINPPTKILRLLISKDFVLLLVGHRAHVVLLSC